MLRCGDSGDWVGTFQGHKGCVWDATLNGEATHAATASADFSARAGGTRSRGTSCERFQHKHIVKRREFFERWRKVVDRGEAKSYCGYTI